MDSKDLFTAAGDAAGPTPRPDAAPQCYYRAAPDSLSPPNNFGLLIKRVHSLLHRVIDQKVSPLGLTAMQWRPLLLIHHTGIDTPAELARYTHVDTGAMTRTLDRLEAKGFLTRQRSLEDRRVVKVALTAAGQDVIERILPAIADTLNIHLDGFTHDEIHMLFALLQRAIANGERYLDLPPGSDPL